MKRGVFVIASVLAAAPVSAQQAGGLPALRAQVDALQTMVDALAQQAAGLPALRAQVNALQATVDALSSRFSQPQQTGQLRGDFATTGSASCVVSQAPLNPPAPPAGFTADFVPRGPTVLQSFSITGVRTFDGDGNGIFRGRLVSIGGAASAADIAGAFTYGVAGDGTVTIDQGPITSTFIAGPLTGQVNRVSGIPVSVGHISKDGQTILFAGQEPAIETITRVDISPEVVVAARICHRSRVAVRID